MNRKGQPTMKRTVFERNGGFARVNRVVMTFYEKVLESDVISPFFKDTDMRTLIDHQTRFIASVMGGPASYTNDHIERVHARLAITEEAFAESVSLLTESLEDHDYPDEDIQIVLDEIMSRKRYIVTRS
jgi:hemoglobin